MPNVGDPAPQFSGKIFGTDQKFTLKDHQGEIVVLEFSGLTWCAPCQVEAPILQDLWEDFNTCYIPKIWFVMIIDTLPGKLAEKYGITFPIIVDDSKESLFKLYGVTVDNKTTVPQLYVVGPDQKICAHKVGAGGPDELRSLILNCGASKAPWCRLDDSRWLAVAQILFGVTQDGGGVYIFGGKPKPVPPWDPLRRDALLALAISELVVELSDSESRRTIERGALDALGAAIKRMRERFGREPIAFDADRVSAPARKVKGG